MAVDIGAAGSMGLAQETVIGTYVAPTKFFPIISENLKIVQTLTQRRGIRQVADVIGTVPASYHVEGDVVFEVFEEVLPYFLMAARTNCVKSGTTNLLYTFTGAHHAGLGTLGKTLSLTVVRNNTRQAYVGCYVSQIAFTVNNGILQATASIMGLDEATQADPTETYPATQVPYGPGSYTLEFPTASAVTDADTFTFTVNDNASVEDRLKTTRTPAYIRFGERAVTLAVTRDYQDRTEYDAFKAATAQSVSVKVDKGANNYVHILMPVGYRETYEFGLSAQGDLIRAQVGYFGQYDATTTAAYSIVVGTQESIT